LLRGAALIRTIAKKNATVQTIAGRLLNRWCAGLAILLA
jgi:hypothetical protein